MTKKKLVELLQNNNDTLRAAKQKLSACSTSIHDIIQTRIEINDSIIREMAGDEEIG